MVELINDEEIKEKVALSCRILARECPGRSQAGHVSVRGDDGETILIKARGPEEEGLDFVQRKDIIRLNFDGIAVESTGGLAPPQESQIHLSLYKARPEVGCVIHVHPRVVVALYAASRELLPIYNAYDPSGARLLNAGIPVFEKSMLINSSSLADELAEAIGPKQACVLRGHGIVTVGKDIEEATSAAVAICELAEVNWMSYAVGAPSVIPEHERMSRGDRDVSAHTRQRRSDGTTANWHWLRQRAAG